MLSRKGSDEMTIEQLTDEQRKWLASWNAKVLRIIDEQSAEIERLRSCFAATEVARLKEALEAEKALSERRHMLLVSEERKSDQFESENARLKEALVAEHAECKHRRVRAEAAESECAALRAKLIDREGKFVAKHAQLVAAESRLADADALLEWHRNLLDELRQLCFDTDADPKPQWNVARDMNRLLTIGQRIDAARKALLANQPTASAPQCDEGPDECMSPYRDNYDPSQPATAQAAKKGKTDE